MVPMMDDKMKNCFDRKRKQKLLPVVAAVKEGR